MQITLNKDNEVPLHEQLAEQVVYLITTGRLRKSEQLPSVRSLARTLKIHHNTVSKSYQDLVARGWLKRQRGSRLCVGTAPSKQPPAADLDELINQSIRRAVELGYSLQELRTKVVNRLSAQPPDHILVVESEPELCALICSEIESRVGKTVKGCSKEEFLLTPELSFGAQVVAPEHVLPSISSLVPLDRPCMGLTFTGADDHLAEIRQLTKPCVIGVASVSKTFLRTARSLLAPVIGQQHSLQEFLLPLKPRDRMDGVDLALCDSIAMPTVRCRRKIHYRLLAAPCLEDLAVAMVSSIPPQKKPVMK
jgi:DNA-binding transcriptional regulator YhcF (GntR family)